MKRHVTPSLISFITSVVLLIALVVVLVLLWPRQQPVDSIRSPQPAAGPAAAQPIGPRSTPALSGNLVPINNVDPHGGRQFPVRSGPLDVDIVFTRRGTKPEPSVLLDGSYLDA